MGGGLVYVHKAMHYGRASRVGTTLSVWECDIPSHASGCWEVLWPEEHVCK